MVSSLSPDSVELALILARCLHRRRRMAPERSVGKLGDTLDGRGEFAGTDNGELGVIARHDSFKVGELTGELACA